MSRAGASRVSVRWGLLSTAKINDKFIAGCAASDVVQISAVASRDLDRARAYAQEKKIPRAHGSYEALLADPEVDAVYISLPNALHLEWTQRGLRAGKHVLCEKPLGRDPASVASAFDLADREGRLLMEGFMYRHHPQTLRLTEIVRSGVIGRVRLIRATFSFRLAGEGDVRLRRALEGGALMDVGCYCVSAARLLAGEPVQVSALQELGGDGVDVLLTGLLRFSGGELALFDCGFVSTPRDELEVIGETGSLFLDDPWHCRRPVIELRSGDSVEHVEVQEADSYRLEAENFAAAVLDQSEPLLGRADAVGQAATIGALYAAAASGHVETPVHG
jgi:D-xylose 1-dehydrogenase (NADP+, D-xylono-1,5-lactone-forming)